MASANTAGRRHRARSQRSDHRRRIPQQPDGRLPKLELSFYLCETQPKLYAAYLGKQPNARIQRLSGGRADGRFSGRFCSDLKMFDAKFLRYMKK
jgi:hypothetical protein